MIRPKKAWFAGLAAIIALFAALAAGCGETLPTVTLTFETNCDLSVAPIEAEVGSEIDLPTMERGGWSFEGWYESADFSGEALKTVTVPDAGASYYAKWVQMYLILFDTDGGTLSADACYVKAGENVLNALSSYVPEKEGLTFGGWFYADSGEAVGKDDAMPEGTVSLLARYLVSYRAELYTKDLEGDGYTLDSAVDGADFIGEKLTLQAPALPHFIYDEEAENVVELKLQLPAERNVFRFYYNRDIGYSVLYDANAPSGFEVKGETEEQTLLYGASATVRNCGFTVRNHRFAGWSTQRNGSPEYAPGATLLPTGDTILYAVWDRGYTDRLGGSDVIYLPESEEGVAILSRGGVECRGTVSDGSAVFQPDDGAEMKAFLSPSMYTFAWKNDAMSGTYSAFYGYYFPETDSVGMISDQETLEVGEDMTAVYRYEGTDGEETFRGILRADGDGYSFLDGETVRFTFRFGTVEHDGTVTPVFYSVGEEAGEYYTFVPVGDQLLIGSPYLLLDGMGGLLYDTGSGEPIEGYYHIDKAFRDGELGGKLYTAILQDGNGYEEVCFMTYDQGYSYLLWRFRDETAYGVFTGKAGETLTLDGYGAFADSAVYETGDKTYQGTYSVSESEIFGALVTMNTSDGEFTFRLNGQNGFEQADPSAVLYEMYRLVQGPNGATLESVMLVTYDTAAETGKLAELYVVTGNTVRRATAGYYTAEDLGGVLLYTFTRTDAIESDLKEYLFFEDTFTYLVNDELSVGGMPITVYYVYAHDGVESYTLYTEENGDATLWRNDFGVTGLGSLYFRDGKAVEGSLSVSGVGFYENQTFASFTYTENRETRTQYFLLVETEEETNSFRLADFPSRTLVNCPATGPDSLDAYSSPYSLVLDGVGGAIYAPGGDASVNDQNRLVKGSYAATGATAFGDVIYTYTPEENSLGVTPFEFTMEFHQDSIYGLDIIVGMYIYHKKDVTGPNGSYFSPYGDLVLDGFCNKASFTEPDGTPYQGIYSYLNSTGASLRFYDAEENAAFTVDFADEFTITVRDGLDGMYALYDDAYQRYESRNYTVILDGYGEAVLNLNGRETGRGTYTPTDVSYVYRFDFDLRAGGTVSYLIAFASANGTVFCIVRNTALSGAYLAENWTVLTLNGFGQGVLIDELGIEHPGAYSLIGAGEGAFEYSDGTGGFRFSYDVETGSFVYNSAYFNEPLVYYASDLSSVVYNGMFAIYDGRAYYFNLDGKNVTLFTGADSEEIHVELPSGPVYQYGGKTYYRYTPGTQLVFENTDSEISIDLDLSFTPNGENDYVAFEAEALFGSSASNVAVGYGEDGSWQAFLFDLAYGYELEIKLHWNPTGRSTYEFVDPILETTEEYADTNAEGGVLTFYYYAVGGMMLQGRVVGALNYGHDTLGNPFSFEADLSAMETVSIYETELGTFYLSQIIFEAKDSNLYAIRFFLGSITTDMMEGETWYTLDSITICKEFNVSDESGLKFLVRTYQHVYAYPEYSEGYEWGDLYDCDLYLDTEEEGGLVFLTPRFYSISSDQSTVAWGVIFDEETKLGFVIDLTYGDDGLAATAAVRTTYYGQYADEEETYFVEVCYEYNISLKTFDIIGITVLARYDEEEQIWKQVSAVFEQNEDGSWRAITEDGVFEITITLEENFYGGYYGLLHIKFTPNASAVEPESVKENLL